MNYEHIIQYFIEEVFNRGNISVIHEAVSPNYKYTSPTERMNGPQELAAFVAAFRSAFPDLKISILEQLSTGESVTTRIRFTGSHHGDFLGMPPTHKSVDVEGCVISKFQDGLIVEEWEILDQLTLLQQLGATA
ncbi:MAG: ester cyclase [Akkermansiaceae bacterium]